uniref:RING-type domain-containing protein n=1 Tax=Chromera velia CCMP2878 TaxID=1169474 RepID=A0A0G4H675_9ALVE|eukprot:Cvel_24853.t1-p1 / transcript=Cvel_24853.t1 / gene=Cvel_24853 / organism=Chromera_velia_CCMP2878 / gene_product=hypothetical protein / transcript_product=hypothetical protein / location=Cvel_scaffold2743:13725-18451(-) / protein_length=1090 / sequence_SO=supercontig / SO=protein_coding / is_pseudo=false
MLGANLGVLPGLSRFLHRDGEEEKEEVAEAKHRETGEENPDTSLLQSRSARRPWGVLDLPQLHLPPSSSPQVLPLSASPPASKTGEGWTCRPSNVQYSHLCDPERAISESSADDADRRLSSIPQLTGPSNCPASPPTVVIAIVGEVDRGDALSYPSPDQQREVHAEDMEFPPIAATGSDYTGANVAVPGASGSMPAGSDGKTYEKDVLTGEPLPRPDGPVSASTSMSAPGGGGLPVGVGVSSSASLGGPPGTGAGVQIKGAKGPDAPPQQQYSPTPFKGIPAPAGGAPLLSAANQNTTVLDSPETKSPHHTPSLPARQSKISLLQTNTSSTSVSSSASPTAALAVSQHLSRKENPRGENEGDQPPVFRPLALLVSSASRSLLWVSVSLGFGVGRIYEDFASRLGRRWGVLGGECTHGVLAIFDISSNIVRISVDRDMQRIFGRDLIRHVEESAVRGGAPPELVVTRLAESLSAIGAGKFTVADLRQKRATAFLSAVLLMCVLMAACVTVCAALETLSRCRHALRVSKCRAKIARIHRVLAEVDPGAASPLEEFHPHGFGGSGSQSGVCERLRSSLSCLLPCLRMRRSRGRWARDGKRGGKGGSGSSFGNSCGGGLASLCPVCIEELPVPSSSSFSLCGPPGCGCSCWGGECGGCAGRSREEREGERESDMLCGGLSALCGCLGGDFGDDDVGPSGGGGGSVDGSGRRGGSRGMGGMGGDGGFSHRCGPAVVAFLCGHRFHTECANSWSSARGLSQVDCPVCLVASLLMHDRNSASGLSPSTRRQDHERERTTRPLRYAAATQGSLSAVSAAGGSGLGDSTTTAATGRGSGSGGVLGGGGEDRNRDRETGGSPQAGVMGGDGEEEDLNGDRDREMGESESLLTDEWRIFALIRLREEFSDIVSVQDAVRWRSRSTATWLEELHPPPYVSIFTPLHAQEQVQFADIREDPPGPGGVGVETGAEGMERRTGTGRQAEEGVGLAAYERLRQQQERLREAERRADHQTDSPHAPSQQDLGEREEARPDATPTGVNPSRFSSAGSRRDGGDESEGSGEEEEEGDETRERDGEDVREDDLEDFLEGSESESESAALL